MPKFSAISLFRLQTCHQDLVTLFTEVVKTFDCSILEGYRTKEAQEAAFLAGKTKLHYPDGNHNKRPSMASDVAPYPVNFNDIKRFYFFGGYVLGVAEKLLEAGKMAHRVRWGGAWNGELNRGNMLNDYLHFELIP